MVIHNGACAIVEIGDAAQVLRRYPDDTFPCSVTSPPYDDLRTYGGFTFDFEAIARELYRVMTPGGVLCWNVGDSVVNGSETLTSCYQKIFFSALGFRVHDTMIYEKSNFSAPETVRYHQTFEYVFILSKGKPRCFNPLKDRRNLWAGHPGAFGRLTKRARNGEQTLLNRGTNAERPITEFGMRTNVWRGNTAGQERPCTKLDHPAQMPEWLAGDLILSWSNPGELILDPCGGSGTTAGMALKHGRSAVICESNPLYAATLPERCAKILQ